MNNMVMAQSLLETGIPAVLHPSYGIFAAVPPPGAEQYDACRDRYEWGQVYGCFSHLPLPPASKNFILPPSLKSPTTHVWRGVCAEYQIFL